MLGLTHLIDKIANLENELLQTQIDVWLAGLETDEENLIRTLEISNALSSFHDVKDLSKLTDIVSKSLQYASCDNSWLSILRHMLLLPANSFQRYSSFLLFSRLKNTSY